MFENGPNEEEDEVVDPSSDEEVLDPIEQLGRDMEESCAPSYEDDDGD